MCGKHYIGPKVEQVVTDFNIHHVVCLVEEHELVGRYDNYIQWHRDNANSGGIWFAMPDLSYPDFDDCFEKVNGLAELVRDQGNMLVHCAAGIGRAGTTATAILMILGMDEEEATLIMCVYIAPWQALRLERNEISLQIWVDSSQNNADGEYHFII